MFGSQQEIDLIPGGANVPVTKHNRLQYIYLLSSLYLDKSIKKQCDAFRRGLSDIVPKAMLRMFSEPELQVTRFLVAPCSLSLQHQSIFVFAVQCRRAGVDLRLLVWVRPRRFESQHPVRCCRRYLPCAPVHQLVC